MSDLTDRIIKSRGVAGISDDDIIALASRDGDFRRRVEESHKAGLSNKDILDRLAKKPEQHSTTGSVLAAVGRGGVGGIYDIVTSPYAVLAPEAREKIRESILSTAPKSTTTLEKAAEGFGEGAVSTIPGIGVGARLASLPGKIGTVGRFLAAEPEMQTIAGGASGATEKATDSPGAGLAAAAAVPAVASLGRKIANPNLSRLVGDQFRLVNLAEQMGIPMTPARKTGNPILRQAEATARALPGSSGVMHTIDTKTREAINRKVLQVAGINEPYATTDVLARLHTNLQNEAQHLSAMSSGIMDAQFGRDVVQTVRDYHGGLTADVRPVFTAYVKELEPYIIAGAAGRPTPMTGKDYDTLRKKIAFRSRTTQDPYFKEALHGLMEALDGAMERASPPDLRPQWQDFRRRYAASVVVENSMAKGTADDRSKGNIPLGAFRQEVARPDRRGFARGRGQYNDISRVGEFIGQTLPTSGTQERHRWERLLQGAPLAGLGYGAATGDFLTPLAVGTAALSPYAISRLYTSDPVMQWLTRQSVNNKGLVQTLADMQRSVTPQAIRQDTERKPQELPK